MIERGGCILTSVKVGPVTIPGVREGTDRSSAEAVDRAKRVVNDNYPWHTAMVSRTGGLVALYGGEVGRGAHGVHFKNALCGDDGNGSQAAATILSLFGFGAYDEIFSEIKRGGDKAFYRFSTN